MKSYVIYQFFCSGCNWKYIGKIEQNLCLRLKEHATKNGSSVFNHTSDSAKYQYIKNLYCIENKSFDAYTYDNSNIQENTNIIDSAQNWTPLLKKEELHIKLKKLILNSGLTLFRTDFFWAAHGWFGAKRPLTHPTIMKFGTFIPYLRKIQKQCKSRDTPIDISIFLPEISKFCYIKKYRYRF